ncbi:hypothetical protein [Lentibacillus sp. Marseille-P4043]|uniref:hypothetical protein n=1 Tax=Lentibacillus sp. Marseille-P4043 TaxID=2040293 RepID=UPI00131A5809|nr:hypothetical protein [Lentibacillus sp. Marseille-P4043]
MTTSTRKQQHRRENMKHQPESRNISPKAATSARKHETSAREQEHQPESSNIGAKT